ncbi:MAG TPA: NapC/NirT family cytochrome c [Sedimentisphaerales bacterium]|nr:NapC/NirT family cytochrome c [Sedimentisphaerales bacterium]
MKNVVTRMVRKSFGLLRKYLAAFVAGLAFAIGCFLAVNAVARRFSTAEYCGGNCHQMRYAYRSWELSPHYANDSGVVAQCVDCHLPPKEEYFRHMTAKAYAGIKDIYKYHFGGEYDSEKMRSKVLEEMPNQRCLNCHSNLLAKPRSSATRLAHQTVLNPKEDLKPRCVECHEQLHEREKKVFSPDQ